MFNKISQAISTLLKPKRCSDSSQTDDHATNSSQEPNPKINKRLPPQSTFVHPDPDFKYVEQFVVTTQDFLTEKTDHTALDELLTDKKYGSTVTEELMGYVIDSYIRDHVERGVMTLTLERGEAHMANLPDIREGAKETAKQIKDLKQQGILSRDFGEDLAAFKMGIAKHIFATYVLSLWINQNISKTVEKPKECLNELFLGDVFSDSGTQRGQMRNTFIFSVMSYAKAYDEDFFMCEKAKQIQYLSFEEYDSFMKEIIDYAPEEFYQRLLSPTYS